MRHRPGNSENGLGPSSTPVSRRARPPRRRGARRSTSPSNPRTWRSWLRVLLEFEASHHAAVHLVEFMVKRRSWPMAIRELAMMSRLPPSSDSRFPNATRWVARSHKRCSARSRCSPPRRAVPDTHRSTRESSLTESPKVQGSVSCRTCLGASDAARISAALCGRWITFAVAAGGGGDRHGHAAPSRLRSA